MNQYKVYTLTIASRADGLIYVVSATDKLLIIIINHIIAWQ